MRAYRIVEIDKNGRMKTLFHGIRGSRFLFHDIWYEAEEKMVTDGSSCTTYLSGFNVLENKEDCEKYLERFTAKRELKIVSCEVEGLRPKSHSRHPVMLAKRMKILTK